MKPGHREGTTAARRLGVDWPLGSQDLKQLAVVMGASSGIGLELAAICADGGFDLIVAAALGRGRRAISDALLANAGHGLGRAFLESGLWRFGHRRHFWNLPHVPLPTGYCGGCSGTRAGTCPTGRAGRDLQFEFAGPQPRAATGPPAVRLSGGAEVAADDDRRLSGHVCNDA